MGGVSADRRVRTRHGSRSLAHPPDLGAGDLSRVAEPPSPALAASSRPRAGRRRRVRAGACPAVAGETAARRTADRSTRTCAASVRWRGCSSRGRAWPRVAAACSTARRSSAGALWVRGPRSACGWPRYGRSPSWAPGHATAYGTHVAGELGSELAWPGDRRLRRAFGIDGAAHRGCAGRGRRHGRRSRLRRRPCPTRPRHATLLERIAADGLVVSEYPPGQRAARSTGSWCATG